MANFVIIEIDHGKLKSIDWLIMDFMWKKWEGGKEKERR